MSEEIEHDYDSDYRRELCRQADFWGMDSLTEIEQCIVNREVDVTEV